jgi:6,7-dimethyl-8-ribityllumazine synthase
VALGVVIRGATYHFEIVSDEAPAAIMDLTVGKRLCIGNGVLTVEDADQAWARARPQRGRQGRRRGPRGADDGFAQAPAPGRQAMSGHVRQARSVARLAAVQALYQMEVSSAGVETVIREFASTASTATWRT